MNTHLQTHVFVQIQGKGEKYFLNDELKCFSLYKHITYIHSMDLNTCSEK